MQKQRPTWRAAELGLRSHSFGQLLSVPAPGSSAAIFSEHWAGFRALRSVVGLFCIILIEIQSRKTIGADHFARRTWRSDRELCAFLWAAFWKRRAFPRLLAPFRWSSVGMFAEFRKTGSCAAVFRPKTRGKRKKRPSYLVETDMTTFSHTSHFHATP